MATGRRRRSRGPLNPLPQISTAWASVGELLARGELFLGQHARTGRLSRVQHLLAHSVDAAGAEHHAAVYAAARFFCGAIRNAADALAFVVASVWASPPTAHRERHLCHAAHGLSVSLFTWRPCMRACAIGPKPRRAANAVGRAGDARLHARHELQRGDGHGPRRDAAFRAHFHRWLVSCRATRSWRLYSGFVVAWCVLILINYSGPRSGSAGFNTGVSAYAWWLTQTRILLLYLKLFVWPWPLVIFYEFPYFTTIQAAWPWLLPVLGLIVATLVLVAHRTAVGFA